MALEVRDVLPAEMRAMIDTEAKQLRAIGDLYAIVKAQPKYASLKEPNWSEATEPVEVLQWLLRKLGPLAKGNEWYIDWSDNSRSGFHFVVLIPYHSQKVGYGEEWLPLDFLPFLRDRDPVLHDLILDVVALVNRENRVPLWDEDGDFSNQLEVWAVDGTGIDAIDNQIDYYETGIAHRYLWDIRSRQAALTPKNLKAKISRYRANSMRKRWAQQWLESGVALAESKGRIEDHTYIPNFRDGCPVRPCQKYKFVWSLHRSDHLSSRVHSTFMEQEGDGSFRPIQFSVTRPGEIVQPVERKPYPEQLFDFMKTGYCMVLGTHRRYYYKNLYEDTLTPMEICTNLMPQTLLEILPELEVEQQIQIRI